MQIIKFFQSLRGKLILTYTLVTVLALLALEILVLFLGMFITSANKGDTRDYLNDVIITLGPKARVYLQPGQENLPGLQAWLEQLRADGYASLPPQYAFDSPAARIVPGEALYVLSVQGKVLAQAPRALNNQVGRQYTPPQNLPEVQTALKRAANSMFDPIRLSTRTSRGDYLLAVPVTQNGNSTPVVGILLVTVAPPVPVLVTFWPLLLGWVGGTALILLIAVAPFGALFGLIMSRGLTRRLKALTSAVDAWGEGDFRPAPTDRSQDEIGYLGRRMRNMAEHIQTLLQTQQELAMMEERNRLARELHDTVKQQTFATLMQVRAARNRLAEDPQASARHLAEAEEIIKASQQELTQIIKELRPAALEGTEPGVIPGLAEALRHYLETWSLHARIPATYQVSGEHELPMPVEQALYRVAQEALSNVARHSRASAVTLELRYEPAQVCLSVRDNGVGFDPKVNHQASFGLLSIRERLDALRGSLLIQSVFEQGTTLQAVVPLEEAY